MKKSRANRCFFRWVFQLVSVYQLCIEMAFVIIDIAWTSIKNGKLLHFLLHCTVQYFPLYLISHPQAHFCPCMNLACNISELESLSVIRLCVKYQTIYYSLCSVFCFYTKKLGVSALESAQMVTNFRQCISGHLPVSLDSNHFTWNEKKSTRFNSVRVPRRENPEQPLLEPIFIFIHRATAP